MEQHIHDHIVIESHNIILEGRKIYGILAIPRESRNGNFYPPSELARNHGKIIPIDLEHDHTKTIGEARIIWDAEKTQLRYEGSINDADTINELKHGGTLFTSLEAAVGNTDKCPWDENCSIVNGLKITRMSIVMDPGMLETTVNLESFKKDSSFIHNKPKKIQMESNDTKVANEMTEPTCPEGKMFDKESGMCVPMKDDNEKAEMECPEGEMYDADSGKCVPKADSGTMEDCGKKKEATAPTRIPRSFQSDKTADKKANEALLDIINKAVEAREKHLPTDSWGPKEQKTDNALMTSILEKMNDVAKTMKAFTPVKPANVVTEKRLESRIPIENQNAGMVMESYTAVENYLRGRPGAHAPPIWHVNLETWMEKNGYTPPKKLREVLKESISATGAPALTFQRRIVLDPEGISVTPIRQFCNFVEAAQGTDSVNFYSGNTGAAGFVDVTTGTAMANVALTITTNKATIGHKGLRIDVGFVDIHDIPGDIVAFVNEVMALRAIEDESKHVLDAVWNATGYTPTNWINGFTGVATTAALEMAAGFSTALMKGKGVVGGKTQIAVDGFNVLPGRQVLYLHPVQFQQLILDSDLIRYFQYASPEITSTMVLENLFGVQIEQSNQVAASGQSNDAYRAVMMTKGVSTGFAAGQNLELEADRRPELSGIVTTARHRIKGIRHLEKSAARISTFKA